MWHGDASEQGKTAQQQIHWGMNQALAHGVGLTTIAQPYEELGRAAEAFLRRVESPELPPAHVELPVSLIVRESVGPRRRNNGGYGAPPPLEEFG